MEREALILSQHIKSGLEEKLQIKVRFIYSFTYTSDVKCLIFKTIDTLHFPVSLTCFLSPYVSLPSLCLFMAAIQIILKPLTTALASSLPPPFLPTHTHTYTNTDVFVSNLSCASCFLWTRCVTDRDWEMGEMFISLSLMWQWGEKMILKSDWNWWELCFHLSLYSLKNSLQQITIPVVIRNIHTNANLCLPDLFTSQEAASKIFTFTYKLNVGIFIQQTLDLYGGTLVWWIWKIDNFSEAQGGTLNLYCLAQLLSWAAEIIILFYDYKSNQYIILYLCKCQDLWYTVLQGWKYIYYAFVCASWWYWLYSITSNCNAMCTGDEMPSNDLCSSFESPQ